MFKSSEIFPAYSPLPKAPQKVQPPYPHVPSRFGQEKLAFKGTLKVNPTLIIAHSSHLCTLLSGAAHIIERLTLPRCLVLQSMQYKQ